MLLFVWIGFAVLTAIVASGRGMNVVAWTLLGFLFGPFALGAALLIK